MAQQETKWMLIETKNQITSDIKIEKSKKVYTIFHELNGKEVLFKFNNVTISQWFTQNTFKNIETEGTITISSDNTNLIDIINHFDNFMSDIFKEQYSGSSISNIMMTDRSIDQIFRSSLFNETLRVNVSTNTCSIFDKNKNLLNDFPLTVLKGQNVSVIVRPSFIWIVNQKIGIRWDLIQLMILDKKETIQLRSCLLDDD